MLRLVDEAEEDAIGVDDLAAMDEGQPMPQPLAQRALLLQRLLSGQ